MSITTPDTAPDTYAGPVSVALGALEAAWSALARVDSADPFGKAPSGAVWAACARVAAAELAVSRATVCPACDAGVTLDCAPYCPEAPSTVADIAAIFDAQMA